MSGKEGFILYTGMYDSIREFLSIEQRGMLMDAIHDYQKEGVEPEKGSAIAMAFAIYKNQFRLDHDKQEKRAEVARINGLRGGRPKEATQENPRNQNNPVGLNKTKSVISEPTESYKEKDKVKDKGKEKGKEIPPTPDEKPLVEVKFVEHPVKQPETKTESEDETMKWVAETKQVQQRIGEFVKAYGKEGKPGRIEQEFRDSAKLVMAEHGYDFDKAMRYLVHKANLCYKQEVVVGATDPKFRVNPEKWLSELCWKNKYGEAKETVQPVKNAAELAREDRDMQRRIEVKIEAEYEAYISGIEKALEERDRRAANK